MARSRSLIDRRAVLRAAGQAAITLPFLEIMAERKARAAVAPRRYVVMTTGTSLCRNGQSYGFWAPQSVGRNYPLGHDLAPLGIAASKFGNYGVQDQVSVVSGLKVPWVEQGQAPPPGGWALKDTAVLQFHGNLNVITILTGSRATASFHFTGPSCDQIVAGDARFGATTKISSLALGVQPECEISSCPSAPNLSVKDGGTPNPPYFSPQAVFKKLFPLVGDPGSAQDAQARLGREKSVLDYWIMRTKRLQDRLGKADHARLDEFFSQVRDVEKSIAVTTLASASTCKPPSDPGPDPGVYEIPYDPNNPTAANPGGYAGELERMKAMRELLVLALKCDLTRVATLIITWAQSAMNVKRINGADLSVHACSHTPASEDQYADLLAWHVEQLAYVTKQLTDAPDVDGNRMIDNTVILMLPEGGWGWEPEAGYGLSPHSLENVSVLVAGGGNLGLQPGRHIAKGNKAHPATVFVSAMKAVGVDRPLGDIALGLPELKA